MNNPTDRTQSSQQTRERIKYLLSQPVSSDSSKSTLPPSSETYDPFKERVLRRQQNEQLSHQTVSPHRPEDLTETQGSDRTYSDNVFVRGGQRTADFFINFSQGAIQMAPGIAKVPDWTASQIQELGLWVGSKMEGKTFDEFRQQEQEAGRLLFKDLEEQPLYKLATRFEEFANESLDRAKMDQTPEARDSFWNTQLPQGLGSMTSYIALGFLTRGQSLAMTSTANAGRIQKLWQGISRIGKEIVKSPATYVASGDAATRMYQEAKDSGQDESTALKASRYAAPSGAVQVANVVRLTGRLDKALQGKLSQGIANYLKEGVQSGLNEAIVESAGAVLYNAAAKKVWDEDRGLMENVFEQAQLGGATGFISGFVIAALGGKVSGGRLQRPDNLAQSASENLSIDTTQELQTDTNQQQATLPQAETSAMPVGEMQSVPTGEMESISRNDIQPGDQITYDDQGTVVTGTVTAIDADSFSVQTQDGLKQTPIDNIVSAKRQKMQEINEIADTSEKTASKFDLQQPISGIEGMSMPQTQDVSNNQQSGRDSKDSNSNSTILSTQLDGEAFNIRMNRQEDGTYISDRLDIEPDQIERLTKQLQQSRPGVTIQAKPILSEDPFQPVAYELIGTPKEHQINTVDPVVRNATKSEEYIQHPPEVTTPEKSTDSTERSDQAEPKERIRTMDSRTGIPDAFEQTFVSVMPAQGKRPGVVEPKQGKYAAVHDGFTPNKTYTTAQQAQDNLSKDTEAFKSSVEKLGNRTVTAQTFDAIGAQDGELSQFETYNVLRASGMESDQAQQVLKSLSESSDGKHHASDVQGVVYEYMYRKKRDKQFKEINPEVKLPQTPEQADATEAESENPEVRYHLQDPIEVKLVELNDRVVPNGFRRITSLKGLFIEPLHWLDQKPALKPLADAVRNHYDRWAQRRGVMYSWLDKDVLQPLNKLSKEDRDQVQEQFRTYMEYRETGQHEFAQEYLSTLHPVTKSMVEVTRRIANYTNDLNKALDIKVMDESGWRPIGTARDFFPRKLNKLTQATLRNPINFPEHYTQLVDALMLEGHITTREEAARYLQDYVSDVSENSYFAGVEKARKRALPSIAYDYGFGVMLDYVDRWAERSSQIEFFGQKTTPESKDAFDEYMAIAGNETTRKFINNLRSRVYNKNFKDGFHQTLSFLNKSATGLQLGNWGTATLNLFGGTTLNFMAYPTSANLRALAKMSGVPRFIKDLPNKGARQAFKDLIELRELANLIDEGYQRGALTNDMIQLLRDTNNVEGFIKIPESVQKLGMPQTVSLNESLNRFINFTMKYGGYTPTERFIRTHAQLTGKYFLMDSLHHINKNTTSNRSLQRIRWFQDNGFDYRRLLRENGTGPYTERFIRYTSNLTQGSYKVDQTPIHLDTPIGRFFFKYVKFISQLSRMWYMNQYKPFVESIAQGGSPVRVEVDGVMTTKRVKEFHSMLRYFAAAAVGGELVRTFRSELFGYQFLGPEIEELEKALEDDDRMRQLSFIFDRAFWNLQAVGALTIFGNYWQLTQNAFSRERSYNPLNPPGASLIYSTGEFALDFIDQGGKYTARDLDRFIERQFSLYRSVKRPVLRAVNESGMEFQEARYYAATVDRNWARSIIERWKTDTGIQEKQSTNTRWRKDELTPTKQAVYEALLVGDGERASALILHQLGNMSSVDELESFQQSITSSARTRQPIGGITLVQRREFFEWVNNRLPNESIVRLTRINQSYSDAFDLMRLDLNNAVRQLKPILEEIDRLKALPDQTPAVQRAIVREQELYRRVLNNL